MPGIDLGPLAGAAIEDEIRQDDLAARAQRLRDDAQKALFLDDRIARLAAQRAIEARAAKLQRLRIASLDAHEMRGTKRRRYRVALPRAIVVALDTGHARMKGLRNGAGRPAEPGGEIEHRGRRAELERLDQRQQPSHIARDDIAAAVEPLTNGQRIGRGMGGDDVAGGRCVG